jgi:hypothetical protein
MIGHMQQCVIKTGGAAARFSTATVRERSHVRNEGRRGGRLSKHRGLTVIASR